MNFSSEVPEQKKKFLKKTGNAAKKIIPVVQKVLPVATTILGVIHRKQTKK
jgi:hypothetical protein